LNINQHKKIQIGDINLLYNGSDAIMIRLLCRETLMESMELA